MSHWSTVETQITDQDVLIESLKELFPEQGVVKNQKTVGYYGSGEKCDVVLKGKTSSGYGKYSIGFKKNDEGKFSILTDWYGAKHWAGNEEEFTDKLNQVYSKRTTIKQARKYGWKVREKAKEDGTVQLTLTKY